MIKVFLSSTGKDLEAYRQGAIEVCNRLQLIPIAMEFFEAMGTGATAGSMRKLDECDVYVGIIAHRYGYVEEGHDKSVTEIEFDHAGERGLDRLCFVVDLNFNWPPAFIDFDGHKQLEAFKARIDKLIRATFTDVPDFKLKMHQALDAWLKQRSPAGRSVEQVRPRHFEGRGGWKFGKLRAAQMSESSLMKLGAAMTAAFEEPISEEQPDGDPEENTGISAGYTYLGQFLDHDLTFSPHSVLGSHVQANESISDREARLDLSCIYGGGPRNQPFLYHADGLHMALGDNLTGSESDPNARDVPRNTGNPSRALIADPRNDENVILSQMHSAFLRFHNRMVDSRPTKDFAEVQQMVRFHYQWVVLHDFLPTVIGVENWHCILPHIAKGTNALLDPPQFKSYDFDQGILPLEFSIGAYRFGHSIVRPSYRLNRDVGPLPIFSPMTANLSGFRAYPRTWAIDWSLFFAMQPGSPKRGARRVQPSYKIDTSLINILGNLPASIASAPASLAQRNLIRGLRSELPSGQTVARAMGVDLIPDEKLRIGRATEEDWQSNPPITAISPEFQANAPLWFYVLAEAQQQFRKNDTPIRLGPVGGRIVGEVIAGMIYRDSSSFLRQDPGFRPFPDFCGPGGEFKMADLLRQSMQV